MFMVRQYAACVLMVSALGALVLVAGGIGYLLKAAGMTIARTLQAGTSRVSCQRCVAMRFGSGSATCTVAEPTLVAEGPS